MNALFQQQTLQLIIEKLDIASVLHLSTVNKALHLLCGDASVWINLLIRDFGYYSKSISGRDPYNQYKISKIKREISRTNAQNHLFTRKAWREELKKSYEVPANQEFVITAKQKQLYGKLFQMMRSDWTIVRRIDASLRVTDDRDVLACFIAFNLFGDQYNEMEEYELLTYAKNLLLQEFEGPTPMLRAPRLGQKLLYTIGRRAGAQIYLRDIVEPIVHVCSATNLELNPAKFSPTEANVQSLIAQRVQVIVELVETIISQLENTIEKIPYSVRWLCKFIYEEAQKKAVEKPFVIVATFFMLRFLIIIVVEPSQYFPIAPLSNTTRRNLIILAQVLQSIANNVSYGHREEYARVLNEVLVTYFGRFNDFLKRVVDVDDLSRKIMLGKYTVVSAPRKPIYTSLSEIYFVQDQLTTYIASGNEPASDEPLREIVRELNKFERCEDSNAHVPFSIDLAGASKQIHPEVLYKETKRLVSEVTQAVPIATDISPSKVINNLNNYAKQHPELQDFARKIAIISDNCNSLVKNGLLLEEDDYQLLRQDLTQELRCHEQFVANEFDNLPLLVRTWESMQELNEFLVQQFPKPPKPEAAPTQEPTTAIQPQEKSWLRSLVKRFRTHK